MPTNHDLIQARELVRCCWSLLDCYNDSGELSTEIKMRLEATVKRCESLFWRPSIAEKIKALEDELEQLRQTNDGLGELLKEETP